VEVADVFEYDDVFVFPETAALASRAAFDPNPLV